MSVLPFVVAITGNRNLKGCEAEARTRLDALFTQLDEYGHTEKILLSGLAKGADIIAAEVALAHKWRVIAVLPFATAAYRKDFDDADLPAFEAVLAQCEERPLSALRGKDGKPLDPDRFAAPRGKQEDRDDHYEQLGLYLARHAGLMIAVLAPGGKTGKPGGTGRVAGHRISEPDAAAVAIKARSFELAAGPPLCHLEAGPVWEVHLGATPRQTEPLVRLPSLDGADGEEAQYRDPMKASLAALDWIEDLNAAACDQCLKRARKPLGTANARDTLYYYYDAISEVQERIMPNVRNAIKWLGGLFVLTILAYELCVELKLYAWTAWMSFAYLLLVLAAVAIYSVATGWSWQPRAEEYRAVSESLRVQVAWWDADHSAPVDRVDRYYLTGMQSALREIRVAISQALNAALVQGRPAPDPGGLDEWIDGQIDYFQRKSRERNAAVQSTTHWSWFLFAVSIGAAMCFAAMHWPGADALMEEVSHWRWNDQMSAILQLLAGAAILARIPVELRSFGEDVRSRPTTIFLGGWACAILTGIALSGICAMLAGMLPLPHVEGGAHGEGYLRHELMVGCIGILVILPAAIAGTMRFIAEKLSWISEARSYEEALYRFRRGRAALDRETDPVARSEIVHTLGVEALRENEGWLRSHRERPIEPLAG